LLQLQKEKIGVSGDIAFEGTYTKQDAKNNYNKKFQPGIAGAKAAFHAEFDGEGFKGHYSARINAPVFSAGQVFDRNVLGLDTEFGTLQFGNTSGPYTNAQLAQGLLGDNWAENTLLNKHIAGSAGSVSGHGPIGHGTSATKFTFDTKRYNGFAAHFAYTPSTAHAGLRFAEERNEKLYLSSLVGSDNNDTLIKITNGVRPYGVNNVALGASYEGAFSGVKVGFAGVFVHDSAKVRLPAGEQKLHHTNAYMLGAKVGYANVELGLEYINNGKSRQPVDDALATAGFTTSKAHLGNAGRAVTVAAKYSFNERQSLAAAYGHTWRNWDDVSTAKKDHYSIVGTHKFNNHLEVYATGSLVKHKLSDAVKTEVEGLNTAALTTGSNKGYYLGVGARVSL